MIKTIDKNAVIFTGIVAVCVTIAAIAISIYFGMRAGGPFTEVLAVIFLKTDTGMDFFVASIILIAVYCFNFKSDKLIKQLFIPALILSVVMLTMNLILVHKNFLSIFNSLFWVFTLIYLYQNKGDTNKRIT